MSTQQIATMEIDQPSTITDDAIKPSPKPCDIQDINKNIPTDSLITPSSTPPSSEDSPDPPSSTSTLSSPISEAPGPKRRLTDDILTDAPIQLELDGNRILNSYEKHAFGVEEALQKLQKYLVQDSMIVEDLDQGKVVIDGILEGRGVIAVDCEGVNLGDRNNGKVTLVQIGDMNGAVYLFDVQVEPQLADELKRVLESEDVVKVMHDCQSDSKGLNHQFKIKLKNVFDTQSAHRVIQKRSLDPAGPEKEDKNAGLDKICRTYGGAPSPFKDAVKGVYKRNQNFWAQRPLNELMISYAASDVLCLVPTVYQKLRSLITTEEDNKLLSDYCADKINPPPPREKERKPYEQRKRGGRGGRGSSSSTQINGYDHQNDTRVNNRPYNPSVARGGGGYFYRGGYAPGAGGYYADFGGGYGGYRSSRGGGRGQNNRSHSNSHIHE